VPTEQKSFSNFSFFLFSFLYW